jgi:hypothetical protein
MPVGDTFYTTASDGRATDVSTFVKKTLDHSGDFIVGPQCFLIVACVQLGGNLEATNRRVERISTIKADSEELTRWANRMRGCLDEIANGDNGDKTVPRSCGER